MPPIKNIAIDAETRSIIAAMSYSNDGDLIIGRLPPGQLDRALYERVNKALAALGGKWNRSAKGHIFRRDPREQLQVAVTAGNLAVERDGWFPTPPELVEQMIREAGLDADHIVLEPSAGEGAIADLVRPYVRRVDVIERDRLRRQVLESKGYTVLAHDFLDYGAGEMVLNGSLSEWYPRILMNPPFEQNQDIIHVTHAWEHWLAPGGCLVAIMSEGSNFSAATQAKEFRANVLSGHGRSVALPPNTFKSSGTKVNARLVTLIKPKEQ